MDRTLNYNRYRGKGRPRNSDYDTPQMLDLHSLRQEQLRRVKRIVHNKVEYTSDVKARVAREVAEESKKANRGVFAKFFSWLNKNVKAITTSIWVLVIILWTVWTYTVH